MWVLVIRCACTGICIDYDIAGNSNRCPLICEEMEKEVAVNHTTVTPVHREEEFAGLLESAQWTPVGGSSEQRGEGGGGGGGRESSAREGLSDFIFSSISCCNFMFRLHQDVRLVDHHFCLIDALSCHLQ